MKTTKKEFHYFTIAQWREEQKYLQEQHKNGWRFVKIGLVGLYSFEKCEPEDVVYQLDYNQQGLLHKDEYLQMFRDCGWEYIQDFYGYSYFRKPVSAMNGEEEIFCDDASSLDMMKRVCAGRMLPLLTIFCLIILPNLYIQSRQHTPVGYILTAVFIGLFLLYLFIFLFFGWQFFRYWKSLQK